jgi:glycosyltransferase involved in cell wall biosynthesis
MENVVLPGRNGYLVPDNAPSQLADNIAALLSKRNVYNTSAEDIRNSVYRFSWSKIAEKIVAEYDTAIVRETAEAGH